MEETNGNKWRNPEPELELQLEHHLEHPNKNLDYPNKSGKSELDFERLADQEKLHLESNKVDPELHFEQLGDAEEVCRKTKSSGDCNQKEEDCNRMEGERSLREKEDPAEAEKKVATTKEAEKKVTTIKDAEEKVKMIKEVEKKKVDTRMLKSDDD